ncbi:aquaporin [Candidatus Saccharibacteria bacterium]|nr:aquaporin [Candidatus Saccharibacteria bacterium]
MATKKAGTSAKKTTRSKSQPVKTKVTTVKAVKTETTDKAKSANVAAASVSRFTKRNTALASALIGEFIGTFLLVSVFLIVKGEPLYLGFALAGIVLAVSAISGAHVNPLVTVGAWVTRKISHLRAVVYIAAQVLGAGAAYVALSSFIGGYEVQGAAGANALAAAAGPSVYKLSALSEHAHWFVFLAELLGGAIFAFAFAGARKLKTDTVARAFTVGFGYFVALLIAGVAVSYVGANAAVNPAVAIAGSVIDVNKLDWFAVAAYIVAPLIGGVVGFAVRDVVDSSDKVEA